MIVGSGLIANAFLTSRQRVPDAYIFAAGVSNSACEDAGAFEREQRSVDEVLAASAAQGSRSVYFSTCSVADPDTRDSAYIKHKLAMEKRVRRYPRHVIFRLPQLAGSTPNRHTLLNYLRNCIAEARRFAIWTNARRNIIDVDDFVRIALDMLITESVVDETINIANTRSTTILDIVRALESALATKAAYDEVERGSSHPIDVRRMEGARIRCGIEFDEQYLDRTIKKYYSVDAA